MCCLPADVLALADQRHGRVSRRQLLELGYTSATINGWRRQGLLITCGRGQYLVSGTKAADLGRLGAALERSGEGARIGGAWACGLWGLEGFDLSGVDHVLVDPQRRVRGAPFTVIRSPVPPVDQAIVEDLPTLTMTRALIDVTPTHTEKAVRVAYDDARRAGGTSLDELRERATQLGNVRGAPPMRRLLAGRALRCESEGERHLDTIWLPGDPLPELQVWVACGGRYYRLDFAFLAARLCLEYDGREHHEQALDRYRDHDRDLALAQLNIQTLRISARMLRTPDRTRRQILAVRHDRLRLGLPPIVPCAPPA